MPSTFLARKGFPLVEQHPQGAVAGATVLLRQKVIGALTLHVELWARMRKGNKPQTVHQETFAHCRNRQSAIFNVR